MACQRDIAIAMATQPANRQILDWEKESKQACGQVLGIEHIIVAQQAHGIFFQSSDAPISYTKRAGRQVWCTPG